ncbi:uncharacterized protein N7482_009284 [Penicillium canariense]|uniref:Uncharacterized protein n=1 Tax=Penicillium canariense TaxID=189055 RepID=A0A9W9HR05_9EURO|nr:uncharacterized protein N7482_009284 [Penicillium canariense]KAJ5152806.1 hypothetical protein N7482_009284 [Penicillium canariense]
MAPSLSFLYLSSLVLTYLTPLVVGAPWIVTEYFQAAPVREYAYDYSKGAYSYTTSTTYEEIIPTATSLPEAIQTNTVIETDPYYAGEATIIEKLYPSGAAGTPVPYSAYDGYGGVYDQYYTSIIFLVNLTYSAPTACSTQFTTTTAVTVTPPADATFQRLLPTTAASTSYSVYNGQAFQSSTYMYKYIWVEPTQVPSSSLNRLSDEYYPATLYSGKDCEYESHGYEYASNPYDDNYYDYGMGISPLAILLIVVLGWIGLWFLLGIVEAWFRFRRLMTGWQTRRGMPVCWALTIMPLTLFCLCCFRKGYRARTAHDSAVLQSRWKKMSAWRKLVLFLKWGFRYKYPTVLGPAPERVMPSKRPGKHPGSSMGPPLLFSTPPQTAAYPPVSPVVSLNREAGAAAAGPQMSQVHAVHPQPVPEASGALHNEHEPSHGPDQTEAETQAEARHENHNQDVEIGRAQ